MKPDPDDAADDELSAARASQSSTVEEAMHEATTEDGFPHESSYTPSVQTERGPRLVAWASRASRVAVPEGQRPQCGTHGRQGIAEEPVEVRVRGQRWFE